jgi:hypothetical protein
MAGGIATVKNMRTGEQSGVALDDLRGHIEREKS